MSQTEKMSSDSDSGTHDSGEKTNEKKATQGNGSTGKIYFNQNI